MVYHRSAKPHQGGWIAYMYMYMYMSKVTIIVLHILDHYITTFSIVDTCSYGIRARAKNR